MPARILVIEDDAAIQDLIQSALGDEGYDVAVAGDGQVGLAQVISFQPDLILLDLLMPIMNGSVFLKLYQQQPVQHVPVILMTASGSPTRPINLTGITDHLAKPFDLNALFACVEKHILSNPIQ